MKIAIISDFNIAGQPTALCRAINKYTEHQARCIIGYDDSFAYDKDIILQDNPTGQKEAAEWVRESDFFHFGRGIFNWPGVDWNKDGLINNRNCVVKYYGSELRNNWERIKAWHERTRIFAITGTDWSITGRLLNSFNHLGSYFTKYGDMEYSHIPICQVRGEGPLRICAGSAGSPMKGYDFLHQVIHELQEDGARVELDILSGMSNEKCLERKLESQVTFTSLHGAWGISGIESMLMGHVVMSCLDPWILSHYPENPTMMINRGNLKGVIKQLIRFSDNALDGLGSASSKFAYTNFNTKVILKRYLYLFDLIMNHEEYLGGENNPKYIYGF